MFEAMCSTSFFAFLRVGEITFSSTCPPPIQINHLTKLVNEAHEVLGFNIKFVNFKHSYNHRSKDFVKLLTIKTNGKTRRFDRASVIIK